MASASVGFLCSTMATGTPLTTNITSARLPSRAGGFRRHSQVTCRTLADGSSKSTSLTCRWRRSSSSYHCRSPRSHCSIRRLPSMVGGSAWMFSTTERTASSVIQGLKRCSVSSRTPRNSSPASPPRMARASDGDSGVQPISAAWRTIGNWTVLASVMLSSVMARFYLAPIDPPIETYRAPIVPPARQMSPRLRLAGRGQGCYVFGCHT